jgi:hypothetical protein
MRPHRPSAVPATRPRQITPTGTSDGTGLEVPGLPRGPAAKGQPDVGIATAGQVDVGDWSYRDG